MELSISATLRHSLVISPRQWRLVDLGHVRTALSSERWMLCIIICVHQRLISLRNQLIIIPYQVFIFLTSARWLLAVFCFPVSLNLISQILISFDCSESAHPTLFRCIQNGKLYVEHIASLLHLSLKTKIIDIGDLRVFWTGHALGVGKGSSINISRCTRFLREGSAECKTTSSCGAECPLHKGRGQLNLWPQHMRIAAMFR